MHQSFLGGPLKMIVESVQQGKKLTQGANATFLLFSTETENTDALVADARQGQVREEPTQLQLPNRLWPLNCLSDWQLHSKHFTDQQF